MAGFNLADLFELIVDAVPDRTAVVTGTRRFSYADLDQRANRLAHRLAAGGVGPGDSVGLQLVNGPEYLEGMLACFKLRAVPININYRYVDAELCHLYQDAGLVALVHHRQFTPMVGPALGAMAERRVILEVDDGSPAPASEWAQDYESELAAFPDDRPTVERSGDDIYCVYTGGTTGAPKGVLWRHEDIFFAAMGGGDPLQTGNVIQQPEELPARLLEFGIVALPVPPFMHASAHWLAFSTFFGGGTLVLLPDGHFDPVVTWQLVAAEHVNVLVVVGDAMALPLLDVLEQDPAANDTSSLMALGSGGAILSPSTKQQIARLLPNVIIADAFGSSETGQMGGAPPADDQFGAPGSGSTSEPTSSMTTSTPSNPVPAKPVTWPGVGVSPWGTRETRPGRPRPSSRSTVGGGRCRATSPRLSPTALSACWGAPHNASTRVGRRSIPRRWKQC